MTESIVYKLLFGAVAGALGHVTACGWGDPITGCPIHMCRVCKKRGLVAPILGVLLRSYGSQFEAVSVTTGFKDLCSLVERGSWVSKQYLYFLGHT